MSMDWDSMTPICPGFLNTDTANTTPIRTISTAAAAMRLRGNQRLLSWLCVCLVGGSPVELIAKYRLYLVAIQQTRSKTFCHGPITQRRCLTQADTVQQ